MRILCYGDSNSWGWVPGKLGTERFDEHTRWPQVLQKQIDGHQVIEDCLGARTTSFADTREGFPLRNGLETLPISLETHGPIDIVIVMLGTADCKPLFAKTPQQITDGLSRLIETCRSFKPINNIRPSHILVIAPPIIKDSTELASKLYPECTPKTAELVPLYAELSRCTDCLFLDSNEYVQVDEQEGIHITAESHQQLGATVAKTITPLLTH